MTIRRTLTLVASLALVAAACTSGGTPRAEGPSVAALTPTSVASSVATAQTDGGSTSEGIQVHGHWTIEVRNPDGSVDKIREFENDLTADGGEILARLLYGDRALVPDPASGLPHWMIRLDPLTALYDAEASLLSSGGVMNLKLTASAQVVVDADITGVASVAEYEIVGVGSPTEFRLTSTGVYPAIPVAANQTAYVTVLISFS